MGTLLEAALEFALQGQPVFPCRALDKRPATVNGFKDATTDVDQITEWWHPDWPNTRDYNIGLPTGVLFDVIDVDGLEGANALEEWAEQYEWVRRLPGPTVVTPSGGYHIYVTPTGAGNRAGMVPHVDYRGVGGYVLAPPSRLEHGVYRWTC